MSQSLTYHCDVCGAVKMESNHWFRALSGITSFAIVNWEQDLPEGWGRDFHMDLCGLECAHKAMAKALTEDQ
jgi:hypothetical protein